MKVLFLALLSTSAMATTVQTREIMRSTHNIDVTVSENTVRCSSIGYKRPELKIDVPALDWAAIFNHRTFGEGQPCMTSVVCKTFTDSTDFVEKGEGVQNIPLLVVHTEEARVNEANQTCSRSLVERVETVIHGVTFRHTRSGQLGDIPLSMCKTLFGIE